MLELLRREGGGQLMGTREVWGPSQACTNEQTGGGTHGLWCQHSEKAKGVHSTT